MTPAVLPLFLALSLIGQAEPTAPAVETATPDQPKVQNLGDGKYRIGLVTIDQTTRTITFPATVNMSAAGEKLEFALVHEQGKIHEALLTTKIDAFNLNVALKLLRYKESPELFVILDENYKSTGKFPDVPKKIKQSARLEVEVTWTTGDGEKQSASLNKMITHTATKAPMVSEPWVYGGSYLHDGAFQAKAQGELIAIFTSNISLLNYPGPDHIIDDVWEPNPKKVPTPGTPVTINLKPHLQETK